VGCWLANGSYRSWPQCSMVNKKINHSAFFPLLLLCTSVSKLRPIFCLNSNSDMLDQIYRYKYKHL
jgi:hypothetical protein